MNKIIILFLCVIQYACVNNQQLKFIKSYPVLTNNSIEPSGLTKWGDDFFTVSDKHNKIFRLKFLQDKIVLEDFIDVTLSKGTDLDFEGITHDKNYFYLISEKTSQILKLSKDGKNQNWLPLTSDLYVAGKKAGLFQKHNAYLEGLCSLGNNQFLLAAERQPRGFIEYDANNHQIKAYIKNQAVYDYKDNRSPDFAGLSCNDGVYVLDRNAYMVAQLKKIDNEFQETMGYSYQHVIEKSELKYQNMDYGHAEGLVVDGDYIYIILDNNRDFHDQDPSNNDSLFLKLKI